MLRNGCDQLETGPTGVCDQSIPRIIAPISPPPARQSAVEGPCPTRRRTTGFGLLAVTGQLRRSIRGVRTTHLSARHGCAGVCRAVPYETVPSRHDVTQASQGAASIHRTREPMHRYVLLCTRRIARRRLSGTRPAGAMSPRRRRALWHGAPELTSSRSLSRAFEQSVCRGADASVGRRIPRDRSQVPRRVPLIGGRDRGAQSWCAALGVVRICMVVTIGQRGISKVCGHRAHRKC